MLPNAHLDCYVREPYLHCDESGFMLSTRNWGKEHMASEGLTSFPAKAHAFLSVVFFGDALAMFGEEKAKQILAENRYRCTTANKITYRLGC